MSNQTTQTTTTMLPNYTMEYLNGDGWATAQQNGLLVMSNQVNGTVVMTNGDTVYTSDGNNAVYGIDTVIMGAGKETVNVGNSNETIHEGSGTGTINVGQPNQPAINNITIYQGIGHYNIVAIGDSTINVIGNRMTFLGIGNNDAITIHGDRNYIYFGPKTNGSVSCGGGSTVDIAQGLHTIGLYVDPTAIIDVHGVSQMQLTADINSTSYSNGQLAMHVGQTTILMPLEHHCMPNQFHALN